MTVLLQEKQNIGLLLTEEEQYRKQKLAQKKAEKTFEVAFCGHFSAGKSTILNRLLGADILPTSPIPTSANIIRIKNGELALAVESKKEQKTWTGEIPWDKVREWGMDGNEILSMTITAPLSFLGKYSVILDTPGVDSTDERHQAVTVDELYTTDLIVYCMDYNHVQSETNLYFLKQLSTEKKPIFIIINQIDKHNEKEIPISVFKQSAEAVFKRWGIRYMKLYFTSMKVFDHPLNEFKTFEKELKGILYNSESLLHHSYERLEEGLYQAVLSRLQEDGQEAVSGIVQEMKEKGYDENELDKQAQLKNELKYFQNYHRHLDEKYHEAVGKLYENVTLFPFQTTDLARQWIESLQPNFKVGWLFSKKKTEEERLRRLQELVRDLQDKVKGQLVFHLQNFFKNIDRTKLKDALRFEEKVNELDYTVTEEFLQQRVKTGHLSRDYVFTFTSEITNLIIKEMRQKTNELLAIVKEEMHPYIEKEIEKLTAELFKFKEIEQYVEKISETKAKYERAIELVRGELQRFKTAIPYETYIEERMKMSYPDDEVNHFQNVTLPKESVIETDWEVEEDTEPILFSEEETRNWLNHIKQILFANKEQKLLKEERAKLLERIERYEKQKFVISLFGAFSAGKSSFANALIGAKILPVSPNPTTATVNTVEAATKEYPHRTAVVYVKKERDLNEEIQIVAEQLGEKITLETIEQFKPNLENYVTSFERTYAEYLLTLKRSLKDTTWQLGSKLVVSLEEMQAYIAEEERACLIEKVNIYYDSEITKQGIVLVDTPGVNSIHGRHTNVAFQQMRRSDAIFYLTYYNHAFSKADQYFLQQMGKVNESFGLNKLYFIINASDLANTKEELNGVRKHVYEQLRANGIEKPRLYHLSSKEGLEEKLNPTQKETLFAKFEEAFYRHTIVELKSLSVDLIRAQLKTYVGKIKDSLHFLQQNEQRQKEKFAQLQNDVEQAKKRIQDESFAYAIRDILQEKEELTLYLRERMAYVLQDYFSTAINVAVITSDSKKGLHQELIAAINEWRSLGEYFLQQEMEATYIRLEARMKERASLWLIEQLAKLKEVLPYVTCDSEITIPSLSIEEYSIHLQIDGQSYTSYLRSKKEFFEQGLIRQMKEALVKEGTEKSAEVISHISDLLTEKMEKIMHDVEAELKARLTQSLDNEVKRFAALFDKEEQAVIEKELDELQRFVLA